MLFALLFILAVTVFFILTMWRIYEKAGEPGWACLVPIYSFYVLCKFTGTKNWWLVFIPIANFYVIIMAYINLAKSFGKDTAFALGLIFLGIFFLPILAFSNAQYIGPEGQNILQADIDAIGVK